MALANSRKYKYTSAYVVLIVILIITLIYCFEMKKKIILQTRGQREIKLPILPSKLKDMRFFYNRIGKCGSGTTYQLFNELPDLKIIKPDMYKRELTFLQQRNIVKNITTAKPPFMFIEHTYFIDFDKFGLKRPIYINLVREPYSRLVSMFNFARLESSSMDFDQCVTSNNSVCGVFCDNTQDYVIDTMVTYFAGHKTDRYCGPTRLQLAKNHIHKYFAVVGYLENFPQFLFSLESLFPKVFHGILDIYQENRDDYYKHKQTEYRYLPNAKNTEILKRRMQYEYDLYEFVKARSDQLNDRLKRG